ncbi:hypothetical protein D3C72_2395020 [compost metagenome]
MNGDQHFDDQASDFSKHEHTCVFQVDVECSLVKTFDGWKFHAGKDAKLKMIQQFFQAGDLPRYIGGLLLA